MKQWFPRFAEIEHSSLKLRRSDTVTILPTVYKWTSIAQFVVRSYNYPDFNAFSEYLFSYTVAPFETIYEVLRHFIAGI